MSEAAIRYPYRDPASPELWNGGPGVNITSIEQVELPQNRTLQIEGVARNTPSFVVRAISNGTTVNAAVTIATSVALFRTTLSLPIASAGCTIMVLAGSTELDRVTLPVASAAISLPEGKIAGLEQTRTGFVAGVSDRLVELRSFSQLIKLPRLFPEFFTGQYTVRFTALPGLAEAGFKLTDNGVVVNLNDLNAKVYTEFRRLDEAFRAEADLQPSRNLHEALSELRERRRGSLREALTSLMKPLSKTARNQVLEALENDEGSRARLHKSPSGLPKQRSGAPLGILRRNMNAHLILDAESSVMAHAEWFERVLDQASSFGGRIGILFNDRLRYRPAGLIAGEQLYTLSLAPGEEVQVRQSVETKRQARMENIVDREQEDSLTLSSTWSTDMSQTVNDTSTLQATFNFNEGGNLGPFSIPIEGMQLAVPLSANASMGGSVSEANTHAVEQSTRVNTQLSAQVAAKLRRQHKTRIEITNDNANSLTTTRTLRNLNAQRALTYCFTKVYRREHVTLERYQARLCLRLVVDDPGAFWRKLFIERIDAMDPDNPANYVSPGVEEPDVVRVYQDHEIRIEDPLFSFGLVVPRLIGRQRVGMPADVGSGAFPAGVDPSHYTLASTPSFEMVKFSTRDTGGRYYWPVDSGEFTSEEYFFRLGGRIQWYDPQPMPGQQTIQGEFVVGVKTFPYWEAQWDNGRWLPAFYYASVDWITIRVNAEFNKKDAFTITRAEENKLRRDELLAELTAERLTAMRDSLCSDWVGAIIAAAVSQNMGYPANVGLANARHVFGFEEAVVETAPYWSTEAGLAAYEELRRRLLKLPVVLPVAEILNAPLTSAQAVVYLPIQEGSENDALKLLLEIEAWERGWLVSQINDFRATHFAMLQRALPSYEDVMSPVPPVATRPQTVSWKYDWEKPSRKFDVIGAWHEVVPTDGVHIECFLSDSTSSDEHRTYVLEKSEAT